MCWISARWRIEYDLVTSDKGPGLRYTSIDLGDRLGCHSAICDSISGLPMGNAAEWSTRSSFCMSIHSKLLVERRQCDALFLSHCPLRTLEFSLRRSWPRQLPVRFLICLYHCKDSNHDVLIRNSCSQSFVWTVVNSSTPALGLSLLYFRSLAFHSYFIMFNLITLKLTTSLAARNGLKRLKPGRVSPSMTKKQKAALMESMRAANKARNEHAESEAKKKQLPTTWQLRSYLLTPSLPFSTIQAYI